MNTVQEFLKIREQIIKNSIYNKLLAGKLSKTKNSTVLVGHALLPVDTNLKKKLKPSSKAKFLMCEIYASIIYGFFKIGYAYKDSAIFWVHCPTTKGNTYLSALKKLSEDIYNTYSLNASKQDKIFSSYPITFIDWLEQRKISGNLWTTGFSKALKPQGISFSETDCCSYYQKLLRRNRDWQIFNSLLITLIKHATYEAEKEDVGHLVVNPTLFDSRALVEFISYQDDFNNSELVHYEDFNPKSWEERGFNIFLPSIRALFD